MNDGEDIIAAGWEGQLVEALVDRRAPVSEIRSLFLRQMPEGLRTQVHVGARILRTVLRRREGQGRGGGGRNAYHPLPLIKCLVEDEGWGPEILTDKDDDGHLALHVALIEQCPPNAIRYLVRKAPEAVQVRASASGECGFYPIHLAVDRHLGGIGNQEPVNPAVDDFDMASWEVVKCLLEAWPESIRQTSYRGWTALHHALRHLHRNRPNDRRVVRQLIEMWPESLAWPTEDGHGQLALHVAMTESVRVPDLQHLVRAYPEAIRTKSRSGYLPLHHAFVQPNGTARPTGFSDLPVLRFLVQQDPSALLQRTYAGLLPLHLAFTLSEDGEVPDGAPTLDVVQLMVEACPESVREANDYENSGWIALFYAVSNPYTSPDVLRYLLYSYPESVHVREIEDRRRMAIHLAVEADLSVATIDALVGAGPEVLEAKTMSCDRYEVDDGELPLHRLLRTGGRRRGWRHDRRHGTVLDVARCLVAHDPSSVRETTRQGGKIALHVAFEAEDSPEGHDDDDDGVVEFLLEQWPESVRVATTDRGWLAIHCAAHKGRFPGILRSLLNLWPNSVRQVSRDDKQVLPIHVAAASASTPEPSLQFLLDAWPESVLEYSGEGLLPIHYAACRDGTPDVVRCLLRRRPETVRVATPGSGYQLIHLAALRRRRWGDHREEEERARKLEVVRLLVELDPGQLVAGSTRDGSLPLHLAVRRDGLDEDVVKYFVEQCPESARRRDLRGSLPLHVAVAQAHRRRRPLREVVKTLVASHPDSLQVADSNGRLPFHLAAESDHASLDVLFLLLRRRPESIRGAERAVDDRGGRGRHQRRSSTAERRTTAAKRRRRSDAP